MKVFSNNFPLIFQDGSNSLKFSTPEFVTASRGTSEIGGAVAPMPGVVEKISVEPGQRVEAGDPLVIMIAMKMEVRAVS